MKKIKGRLVKRASQTQLNVDSSHEWTKYDERIFECIQQDGLTKLNSTLTKKGVSVIKLSPNGTTALHFACEKQKPQCLEILLNEKPDLSVLDKTGCNALSVAAKVGSLECMAQLLHYSREIIGLQDFHKKTALHYAAGKGHYECVQLLLENNENLDIRDKDGRTPLLMGIQSGKEEIVKLFLDRGAKVNITDNSKKTSLMYASLLGHEKSVDLLLKRGANSKLQDNNGHTAEDYARIIGYKNIISLIKNAPVVATWDAGEGTGDDEEEKEEEPEIPNVEIVSEFKLHEDSDDETIASSKHSTSPTHRSPVKGERSPLSQESFSSKSSSLMMQRDLTNDVKELEEENEMLNQELSKLRIQHQKTLERLRIAEEELNVVKKNPIPTNVIPVNGLHEDDGLMENKGRRIEDLEDQVSKLQAELVNQTKAKQTAVKEAESLGIQLASYQLQSENDDISLDDDLDLPGVDGTDSLRNTRSQKDTKSKRGSSISEEIEKLKQENQRLSEQLKEQIRNELNHNDLYEPTIPLPVYQQLKDSSEEEIFSLSEQIEELKLENEELEQKVEESRHCKKCANLEMANGNVSSDASHKRYLESEVKRLKKKLKEKESSYIKTINLYRLHLVSLIQGELDPVVEEALQSIISLRASEQFC